MRGLHFRIPSSRSATLRRGRVRCRWQSDQPRRKTETAEKPFRRAGALCLRRARGRVLPKAASLDARRTRDYGFELALPQTQGAAREIAQPRPGLARYRYADELA